MTKINIPEQLKTDFPEQLEARWTATPKPLKHLVVGLAVVALIAGTSYIFSSSSDGEGATSGSAAGQRASLIHPVVSRDVFDTEDNEPYVHEGLLPVQRPLSQQKVEKPKIYLQPQAKDQVESTGYSYSDRRGYDRNHDRDHSRSGGNSQPHTTPVDGVLVSPLDGDIRAPEVEATEQGMFSSLSGDQRASNRIGRPDDRIQRYSPQVSADVYILPEVRRAYDMYAIDVVKWFLAVNESQPDVVAQEFLVHLVAAGEKHPHITAWGLTIQALARWTDLRQTSLSKITAYGSSFSDSRLDAIVTQAAP